MNLNLNTMKYALTSRILHWVMALLIIFLLGLGIFMSVVIASLFCHNIKFAYFLLFMGGISETGRYYVAYVYLIEFVPDRYQNDAGLYIFMCFGIVMTFIAM